MKKILYIDMDNVLVDFPSAFPSVSKSDIGKYEGCMDEVPGIFSKMTPVSGAVEAYHRLAELFDTYILSTSPWNNPSAWSDKLEWVKKYIGDPAYKRLILTHHKNLNHGHFLVDDRLMNGVDEFRGKHLLFGSPEFPDWDSVLAYLEQQVKENP